MAETAAAVRPRLPAGSGFVRRLLSARNLIVLAVVAVVAYLGAVPLGFLLWQTFVRGGHLTEGLSRKGAKAQRNTAKMRQKLFSLRLPLRLCAFAGEIPHQAPRRPISRRNCMPGQWIFSSAP